MCVHWKPFPLKNRAECDFGCRHNHLEKPCLKSNCSYWSNPWWILHKNMNQLFSTGFGTTVTCFMRGICKKADFSRVPNERNPNESIHCFIPVYVFVWLWHLGFQLCARLENSTHHKRFKQWHNLCTWAWCQGRQFSLLHMGYRNAYKIVVISMHTEGTRMVVSVSVCLWGSAVWCDNRPVTEVINWK